MIRRLIAYWRLHKIPIFLLLASLSFYYVFACKLERSDFIRLLTLYAALFFFCFKLIQFEKWNLKFLLTAGLLFRLAFLLAVPNLSQDFYRFIWDGRLLLAGINPYLYTPNELLLREVLPIAQATELHSGMGPLSARHYSNYPPLNQLFFALGAFLGGKSILGNLMAMRLLILLADLGILYLGRKLLQRVNRSPHLIFWYFLNPLVIIELSGNLHFEGVMLFFFLWALYLATSRRWVWSAVLYALSISMKLVPLVFLPLFISGFGWKKSLGYYAVIALSAGLLAFPFLAPGVAANYSATLGLWFSNFEFNAGMYNLVREIGLYFDARPWELIKIYGKITPFLVLGFVLVLTFLYKDRQPLPFNRMLWVLTLYYLLSPTVHPWYLIFLVLLAIYTDFRYPLFWSAVCILSYAAYANPNFEENKMLLLVEYIVVYGMMLYEIVRLRGEYFTIRKK